MSVATKPKEYPMLFAQEFIPKILSGEKTQTRRPIRQQPIPVLEGEWNEWHYHNCRGCHTKSALLESMANSVRWRVGDVLWVKETIKFFAEPTDDGQIEYFGGRLKNLGPSSGDVPDDKLDVYFRMVDKSQKAKKSITVPSILMPRFAARIFLRVTDVRVERLQAIKEADVLAEGIEPQHLEKNRKFYHRDDVAGITFAEFWDGAYPKNPFLANPWVSVTTSQRIEDYR